MFPLTLYTKTISLLFCCFSGVNFRSHFIISFYTYMPFTWEDGILFYFCVDDTQRQKTCSWYLGPSTLDVLLIEI